MFKLIQS